MTDLESHLGKQIAAAERTDRVRESFLDRYLGEKYGDEVEGRSEVVTSEVFDVVESIAAEMMDVLTSADRIATFRPRGPDDEEAAEEAGLFDFKAALLDREEQDRNLSVALRAGSWQQQLAEQQAREAKQI